MKTIKIGEKEYKFEFTIEASLFNDCTEKLTTFIANIGEAQSKADIKQIVSSISDIPQTALTMFYAGLLEHHGEDGDSSVTTKKDAKRLIKQYFVENKDTGNDDFYSILELMLECMGDDGFFKRVGLEKMFAKAEEQNPQLAKATAK